MNERLNFMKKLLALVLAVVLCFSLTACGKEKEPEIVKTALKETVSTDTVDFTLEDSQLTYYVSNNSTTYVEPTEQPNTLYAAKKGTCYVSMTVTIKNTDRGGSISFGGSFNSWNPAEWNVKYNGETYEMFGFDLTTDKPKSMNLNYAALLSKETGRVIKRVGSNNKLIFAGETFTIRLFGVIQTEPQSLKDGFDLEVKVPSSEGYQTFTYEIPAKA